MHKYAFLDRVGKLAVDRAIPDDILEEKEEGEKVAARDSIMLAQITSANHISLSGREMHHLSSRLLAKLLSDSYHAGRLIGKYDVKMTDEEYAELSFLDAE